MLPSFRTTFARAAVLAVAAMFLAAAQVDARPGRGGGFGSRGSRTWSAPAPTPTAPRQAAPIERSTVQPAQGVNRPAAAPMQPARPGGFFSTRGGLLGGFLGAGLLGMFLGYGLFGGLGGLGSILGLLLQVALIVFLARLAFRWFQRRQQPAYAGATPGGAAATLHREPVQPRYPGAGGGGSRPAAGGDQVGIKQPDLDAFERLLGAVQKAYAEEDVTALRRLATPEAASFLAEELADNAGRGVVNHVADVKLLQGDLAEAWREGGTDYATVAMRFALRDWTTERATGAVVEGDPERPIEATEVWTFRRPRGGGDWLLSAIQRT
jgi:predicted lipid-binding transport protein (Tim44 family)